jgi:hypothetical protein
MEEPIAEPWRSCKRAAEALRSKISPDEYENVIDYIEHNECGLSIETLIDCLGDRGGAITPEEYTLISDAMVATGLENSRRLASARKLIEPPK